MAYLLNQQTNQYCYLYAHHTFGRFSYSVDTLFECSSISKIHAIIEWKNQQWVIRDLSTNGTWLNNHKLIKEKANSLKINDQICFSAIGEHRFIVKDLSPPCDLLIPCSDIKTSDGQPPSAITLAPYHLLPAEKTPEVAIIYNQQTGQWRMEYIAEDIIEPCFLNDNDYVVFGNQKWQLKLSHLEKKTELQYTTEYSINDLAFTFDLSLNEESTKLKVKTPEKIIDLQARSHHYLTLNLARYRALDAKKGIISANQGWVNTGRLIKDLGVDMTYLNIQIYRTRKQFSDCFTDVENVENIIERQLRQVRFAGASFEIFKGHQLEIALP